MFTLNSLGLNGQMVCRKWPNISQIFPKLKQNMKKNRKPNKGNFLPFVCLLQTEMEENCLKFLQKGGAVCRELSKKSEIFFIKLFTIWQCLT